MGEQLMTATRHITKDKGDLAVAKTIAHLRENGIYTCLPLSEHLPFDLIAVMPDMKTLRRVQVKYREDHKGTGSLELAFRSNYYDSKRIYSKRVNLDELDCYAVYCPNTDSVYYLRIDEVSQNTMAVKIRIQPTKSGRKKDVWMGNDFIDPKRIGLSDINPNNSRREVSEYDEIAINYVISDLMEKGIQPLIPQSQYVPFDLIGVMPDMKMMQRIRVGYKQANLSQCIDQYAIYLPDQGKVCYFSHVEIQENERFITTAG
jgi:hypothetical protein